MAEQNKLDFITKDVEKRMKVAARKAAKKVTADIQKMYKETVTEFYNHYNPSFYDRTFSTYEGSDGYGKESFDPTEVGDDYLAGIEVSPSNIEGEPYEADKDYVFERTFVKGIHGFTPEEAESYNHVKGIAPMSPPPEKVLEKKVKDYVAEDKIKTIFDQMFNDG